MHRTEATTGRRSTARSGPCVKTAISFERSLLERLDVAAASLDLPRSQLLARAADDYLQRLENRQMLADLDAVYAEPPDEEERRIVAGHRERRRRRAAAE